MSGETLAAQAGLDAVVMHQGARDLNPGSDGRPSQMLSSMEVVHIARTRTLPVVDASQSEAMAHSEQTEQYLTTPDGERADRHRSWGDRSRQ